MQLSCLHIAANCNPMPNCITFLNQNTLAFCFRDQIGIYSLQRNTILCNLNFLEGEVEINRANCLRNVGENVLIGGYDSGHLIVYERQGESWVVKQVIKQNYAISFMEVSNDTLITNNTNAELTFYLLKNQKYQSLETLKFPLNKILETVIQIEHKRQKIIFLAGTDQKIHCYTRSSQNQKLVYRFQLSGHENAITKLIFTVQNGDYLIASSSKDGYIRIWRLTENQEVTKLHKNVKNFNTFYCFLDAVLISHECSVTNLKWVRFSNTLQLASCSLDCTVCLWGYEKQGSAWGVDTRMGQFLGNKNAYFDIVTDTSYKYLVAINYIGSAIIWSYSEQTKKFTLRPSFNGHSNEVKDIDWNHTGNFLVSVSKDQTTRILSKNNADNLYHQISRAQIHGYDINAVSTIKVNQNIIDLIACGADEKVIRIVQPPACFANYLNYTTDANLHLYFPSKEEQQKYVVNNQPLEYETYAEGGTQVLGLMTKMQRVERQKITEYYDDEEGGEEQDKEVENTEQGKDNNKINFKVPPHDDYLVKHTLWPQMNKLYGHPHQIATLAKNNVKKQLASSCEGKNKTFCTIIIWSTETWKILKTIQHHQYTVYAMDFSKCGEYLTSVSKDRKIAVFSTTNFQLLFSYEAHSRAITSVSFSTNSQNIVTGSRDKSIKIHNINDKKCIAQYSFKSEVHSVSYCGDDAIAVGCLNGSIYILKNQGGVLKEELKVEGKYGHTKPVNKLRYFNGLLASCGDDHSVRVFKLQRK